MANVFDEIDQDDGEELRDRIVEVCKRSTRGVQLVALIAVLAELLSDCPSGSRGALKMMALGTLDRVVDARLHDDP